MKFAGDRRSGRAMGFSNSPLQSARATIACERVSLDPFLTVKEAAEFSRLSVRTIRAMLARDTVNALPCRRVGRKIIIRQSELVQYLDAYRVSGRPGVIAALREVGLASRSTANAQGETTRTTT